MPIVVLVLGGTMDESVLIFLRPRVNVYETQGEGDSEGSGITALYLFV